MDEKKDATNLGCIVVKLEAMHNDIKEVKQWQHGHDGQGEGTTHDLLDKRLSVHSKSINILKGIGYVLSFLGLGNLVAWATKVLETHK